MPLSTFLDGRPYNKLRGVAWLALSDTAYWLTLSGSSDAGGGGVVTWGTAGTLSARIDPLIGGEQLVAERIDDRSTHQLTLPPASAVTTNDRISLASGGTYEITAVRERTHELLRLVEVVRL